MLTIFGLKNCDTCRKALKWLGEEEIRFEYFDVRRDGFSVRELNYWVQTVGWGKLLNKRSTTWRRLGKRVKESLDNENLVGLVLDHPTLLKRPIITYKNDVVVGFSESEKTELGLLVKR